MVAIVKHTYRSASYLEIDSEGRLRMKLYDKRDDFNFPIANFPAAPAYGIYISELIRYSRACGSYQDFPDRGVNEITKAKIKFRHAQW
jgi:hypothetical protein